MKIRIYTGSVSLIAQLYDTPTAHAIFEALPFSGRAHTWGDEIYFDAPIQQEQDENATETPKLGELGFWPVTPVFCIFFGPTPVSVNGEPRAASPVNVFGKIEGSLAPLFELNGGEMIEVTALD